MAEILITGAATESRPFRISGSDIPSKISIEGGGASDQIELHQSSDGGASFVPVVLSGATFVIKRDDTSTKNIDGPGLYQLLNKTAGTAVVSLTNPNNP